MLACTREVQFNSWQKTDEVWEEALIDALAKADRGLSTYCRKLSGCTEVQIKEILAEALAVPVQG